mgnify:CR=1 FL=1
MSRNLFFILFRAVITLSFLGSVRFALADISGEWNFSLNVQGQSGSAVATVSYTHLTLPTKRIV